MTEPLRWTLAVSFAAVAHLLMLAWALPGFSLWQAHNPVPFNLTITLSGDGAEIDRPLVPVTLPSGPLRLEWSLGSMTPPPRQMPPFERPERARRGPLALSQLGDAAQEAEQASIRNAVQDELRHLDALAAAPAEFVADIRLAGAQLRLAPMAGGLALTESDALAHQTAGRETTLASAPQPAERAQPAATATPSPTLPPPAPPATVIAEARPPQPGPTQQAVDTTPPAATPRPVVTQTPTPAVTVTTAPTEALQPEPSRLTAMATPTPTRIIPQIYPPAVPSPSPTWVPLPELSAPQPLTPPRSGLIVGEGNAPDQGAGEFTPNSNVFFSRLTAHLFAANQRALAEAIRAGPRLTLEVRFWIDRNGRVLEARVARTSGIPELDRRAEQVLLDASPVPRLARDMPQERLELSFPVDVYR